MAIDSHGRCVEFAIVNDPDEYAREVARLEAVLDTRDPVEPTQRTAGVEAAIRRRAGMTSSGLRLA